MKHFVLYRDADFRGVDEEKRQASFVVSTERAVTVSRWDPPEVLRMSGARLQRYRKNPVVLDTHGRGTRVGLSSVIGRSDVKVVGRELHATITYANNEAGNEAWGLVKDGIVRACSIGYSIKKVRRLREGESDGEGDARVDGPATIATEWGLHEISNVPVPADEDAVRRDFYDSLPQEGKNMARSSIFAGAMEEDGEADESAAPDGQATRSQGEGTTPAPAPKKLIQTRRVGVELTRGERIEREQTALITRLRQVTPKGLEGVVEAAMLDLTEDSVLEGRAFAEVQARLKKAQAERFKPVGTPEPQEPVSEQDEDGSDAQRSEKPLPESVTDDVIVRSFENLGR